jgi:hypothetical protein
MKTKLACSVGAAIVVMLTGCESTGVWRPRAASSPTVHNGQHLVTSPQPTQVAIASPVDVRLTSPPVQVQPAPVNVTVVVTNAAASVTPLPQQQVAVVPQAGVSTGSLLVATIPQPPVPPPPSPLQIKDTIPNGVIVLTNIPPGTVVRQPRGTYQVWLSTNHLAFVQDDLDIVHTNGSWVVFSK